MSIYKDNLKNDIYFHYVNTKHNTELSIISFGYERCARNKSPLGPLSKVNFMLHYIISGKGYYFINGEKYILSSGDIFFTPAQTTIHYFQDFDNPWEYIWMEFNGLKAMQLCNAAQFSLEEPVYHPRNTEIADELKKMICHPEHSIALEYYVLGHIYSFLAQIIDERSPESEKVPSGKSKQIEHAIRYIEDHYTSPTLSLKNISDYLYLNPSYLSRIFREVTGNTISKYIISLRIQKASDLLENKEYPIKDIASMVGYTDPHFFSKEFKKYRGTSPSKYSVEGVYKE